MGRRLVAWAAFGIASKQTETPEIVGAATVLSVVAVLLATWVSIRNPSAG